MNIREARESDVISVLELMNDLEETVLNQTAFNTIFLENINDPRIHYIVAIEDGELVGFASLHIQKLLHHVSNIGEIQEIIVSEKYRSRGIGKYLLDELKAIAKANECSQIEVCCNIKREKSHRFYMNNKMNKTHYKFTALISEL